LIKNWPLASLKEKLIKIGAKVPGRGPHVASVLHRSRKGANIQAGSAVIWGSPVQIKQNWGSNDA
jgi:hypothetical protein